MVSQGEQDKRLGVMQIKNLQGWECGGQNGEENAPAQRGCEQPLRVSGCCKCLKDVQADVAKEVKKGTQQKTHSSHHNSDQDEHECSIYA